MKVSSRGTLSAVAVVVVGADGRRHVVVVSVNLVDDGSLLETETMNAALIAILWELLRRCRGDLNFTHNARQSVTINFAAEVWDRKTQAIFT